MKNYFRKLIDKHSKFTLIEDKQVRMFMRPPFMRFDSVAYDNYMHNKNNSKYFNDNLVIGCKYRINFIKDKIGVYLGFHAPFYRFKTDDGFTSNINGKDLHKFVRSLNGHEHKKPIALVIKMEDELRCSTEQFLSAADKISHPLTLSGRFEIISKSDIKISSESPDFEDLYMDNLISEYINLKQKQDMKQTKLEVGKEYWLGEAKKFKGVYKGNFGKACYFKVTHGDSNFTVDANGFIEFPAHGVFEIEKWQFTTPIAMKCTEEQFNGIKDKLAEMGYKIVGIGGFNVCNYITNNLTGRVGEISNIRGEDCYSYGRTCFDAFNPDLFLALAAMTDKEDGIKGEWWIYREARTPFSGRRSLFGIELDYYRKATAQEIIEHFEKRDFVLPEKWCVKVLTKEQDDAVVAYFNNKYNTGIADFLSCTGWWYYNYAPFVSDGSRKKPDCTEIAFDQFKKYILKETTQSCPNLFSNTNTATYNQDGDFGFLFARRTLPNYLSGTIHMSSTPTEIKTIIPIPPTKQATLFDDRVEITDWKPKEGEAVWVVSRLKNSFEYKKYIFDASIPFEDGEKVSPFIKRTESEAKQLVEKLNQAML